MMCHVSDVVYLFFQAEDGIRDLVRSRGLGDVYKRQDLFKYGLELMDDKKKILVEKIKNIIVEMIHYSDAVSYTHLTLPTSDLV